MRKLRVAVLFGGRSAEHEISRISALAVLRNLDPKKYEVVPIAIERDGRWLLQDKTKLLANAKDALPVYKNTPEVLFSQKVNNQSLVVLNSSAQKRKNAKTQKRFDVVFPVLHGPMGEDGTIQGFLELAGIPYVGSGVLASAVGMDKEVALRLVSQAGVLVPPYKVFRQWQWKNKKVIKEEVAHDLSWPVFVKPARLGSSVGVSKVKSDSDFFKACEAAFGYDDKIIIEKAISAREIECALLGDSETLVASIPGEIIPSAKHEFYSYEAKYLDPDGAALKIPADLDPALTRQTRDLAKKCFLVLECEGMARIDFFLEKGTDLLYFSEVNTIPGFTSISMYPKMMEASGVSYPKLLDKLIQLAIKRAKAKKSLTSAYRKTS